MIDITKITIHEFLNMELSEWMTYVEEAKKEDTGLERLAEALDNLCAKAGLSEEELEAVGGDIRYRYFYKCYVEQQMLQLSGQEEYDTLIQVFHAFTVGVLEYELLIFEEYAFEGEMELLSPQARAAVHLNDMFSREADDWDGKFSDLRQATQSYSALREPVKSLVRWMAEEQQKQKKQTQNAATAELRQMVAVMKEKIRLMIAQGMKAEALGVITQVLALAPQDEELRQMESELRG